MEAISIDFLRSCTTLNALDLGCNDIKEVPPELGLLTSLQHLVLEGNPVTNIRRTILEKPTPQLLEYLKSQLPS